MEYYCAMVLTGKEKSVKDAALKALKDQYPAADFFTFERRLYTKKRGWFDAPLFPGYIFFVLESLTPQILEALKKIKGFYHILRDNQNPTQINGQSLEELKLFIRNGEHWGISKVKFLPGQRIQAISGPLVGLEGNIIAVNKKKKQITVQSTLTNDGKRFDLLYEDVEVVESV